MTNNEGARPGAEEARRALETVYESKHALAGYVRSPRWMYPLQGLGMGLFVIGLVFSKEDGWGSSLLAVAAVFFCLLPLLQARGRVVVDVYTHQGSRMLALVYVTAFVLTAVTALVLYSLLSWTWIAFAAAALTLILTLFMGPAMEARLERSLRNALE